MKATKVPDVFTSLKSRISLVFSKLREQKTIKRLLLEKVVL